MWSVVSTTESQQWTTQNHGLLSFQYNTTAVRYTVEPRYNEVVGVQNVGLRCTRGALCVPISATRELLNNSDRHPLHQVQERCRSQYVLAALSYMQFVELTKRVN